MCFVFVFVWEKNVQFETRKRILVWYNFEVRPTRSACSPLYVIIVHAVSESISLRAIRTQPVLRCLPAHTKAETAPHEPVASCCTAEVPPNRR